MARRVLLTGGAGNLGQALRRRLLALGSTPITFDVAAAPSAPAAGEAYLQGSVTDRAALASAIDGVDAVVHIVAFHGVHEPAGPFASIRQDVLEGFWDVNVTGTANVFELAARAGVREVVFISSTSIRDRTGVYGSTKVIGEEIARTYASRHGMRVVCLRPRAFISHSDSVVYPGERTAAAHSCLAPLTPCRC